MLICYFVGADILKQQGHFHDLNTLAFSADGSLVATGGDDGKVSASCMFWDAPSLNRVFAAQVKLWNSTSGFCFITFTEHESAVTDIAFVAGKVSCMQLQPCVSVAT